MKVFQSYDYKCTAALLWFRVYNVNVCTVVYEDHRMCLRRANANVDCIACYPQVLTLSAYEHLYIDHINTTKPPDVTNLFEVAHYGYSQHLYVLLFMLPVTGKCSFAN